MREMRMALRAAALVVAGLVAAGCGGPEDEGASQGKPSALEAIQAGRLLKNPRSESSQPDGSETRSAQLFDAYYHEVVYVCQTVSGTEYCEDVQGFDDTYYDYTGTVSVWTRERYGDGSYFASFNSSSVSWDDTEVAWEGSVLVLWRHYTMASVTSGTFLSQIHSSNNNYYSDTVLIY